MFVKHGPMRSWYGLLVWAACLGFTANCGDSFSTSGPTSSASGATAGSGGSAAQSGSGGSAEGGAASNGGSTEAGTGGGGAECGPFTSSCCDCITSDCTKQYANLSSHPTSGAMLECLVACGEDSSCVNGCYEVHSAALVETLLLKHCAATTCDAVCDAEPIESDCMLCALPACEAQFEACFATTECDDYYGCLDECNEVDTGCATACAAAYPEGFAAASLFRECAGVKCSLKCENGASTD